MKSFQLAQLIYDITVRFVELYIPAESRTRDQMIQTARPGVQNIAEGSVDIAAFANWNLIFTMLPGLLGKNSNWIIRIICDSTANNSGSKMIYFILSLSNAA